jgi:hypothetical protein
MNSANSQGFLARYGAALIDAGYDIVPIKRGEKRPPFTGWEKIRADHNLLNKWLREGYGRCGVGLIAANTPGVDMDIRDEALALHMEEWVHENVAMAPVRVGHAPKRLLMFRTDESFTKLKSKIYLDEEGRESAVEILGDGQQFVAFHIHPDTDKPFEWLYKDGPHVTDHDDLPTLTVEQAQAIIAEFELQADERGWEVKKKRSSLPSTGREVVYSGGRDVFLEDSRQADISDEELHAKLLMVPAQADYDGWLQIGMALYHQYDGGERGKELWHEWSELTYGDEYDPDEIDDKWSKGKLSINNKGRAPITARLIIKLSNEHAEKVATETVAELNRELNSAKNLTDLKAAAEKVKTTEIDAPTREQIVGLLRDRFKVLTNQTLGLKIARDMVRFENPELKDTPRWLVDWVYMSDEDRFYNTRTRSIMTQQAFNSTFSRFMLTKKDVLEGRAHPERLPAHVALNINQVTVVSGRRYMPEMDEIFTIDGVRYANLYSTTSIPEVPEELSKKDRRNLEIVKAHFAHLFTIERDRELFMDWLAYVVQNPGNRPNWAVMMQGTEQDGKTFFGMMMGAVLGGSNITVVDPKSLEAEFNGFAEGHQLAFIEEVKLHGHNRYDVLNRIKPLITNQIIPIRRMRTDSYLIPNKTAYLLATNFRDALPLNDNDSRYFILFSRFQTKVALRAFKAENPNYYRNLYRAIEESPGAVRGWLLDREFGPEFDPHGRAPDSTAHGYMVMMAKPEEQEAIEEILSTSLRMDLSRALLCATDLNEALYNMEDMEVPQTRKMNKLLSDMGFTYLGRVFVGGRPRRYWSMEPERFIHDGQLDTAAVRNWVECDL